MEQEELFDDVDVSTPAGREVLRERERHTTFIREMVKTGNRTQSAITAGFSKKTAASQGSRLMTLPAIRRAIQHERARLEMLTPDLSPDRLLRELGCIALSDRRALFDEHGKALKVHELDEPTARAILSIDVGETTTVTEQKTVRHTSHHVRLADKRQAIELIARIKGYLTDKVDVNVKHTLEDLVAGVDGNAA